MYAPSSIFRKTLARSVLAHILMIAIRLLAALVVVVALGCDQPAQASPGETLSWEGEVATIQISFLPSPTIILAGKSAGGDFSRLRLVADPAQKGIGTVGTLGTGKVETAAGSQTVPEITIKIESAMLNTVLIVDTQYTSNFVMSCEPEGAKKCRLTRFELGRSTK
jgi:hypothetical protein